MWSTGFEYEVMMRVVYLTQVFESSEGYGSDRHHHFCRSMVEAGWDVTVVTSNLNYKSSTPKYQKRGWKPVVRDHDGIRTYYVHSPTHLHGNYRRRLWHYLTFFHFTWRLRKNLRGADLVYAVSTPLTVGLVGARLARYSRALFYLEISDVWPDVLVEMGMLRSRRLISFLKWMESFCYRRADRITALTRGIQKNIRGKVTNPEKVFLLTNGVDKHLFDMSPSRLREARLLREKLKLGACFVCLYLGAHNLYNALFTVVRAARRLRGHQDVCFVLVGDGDQKEELQSFCEREGLTNIQFFPPVPRRDAPSWLFMADAFVLPNLDGEFYKMNLQNKFFDFLASGRPIVFAGEGESADIIREVDAGRVVPAENDEAVADAVRSIRGLEADNRHAMGERGRRYVLAHFERKMLASRLIGWIEDDIGVLARTGNDSTEGK
jgi:glycosyltransferase involved in cell wall biosynthesis